jgi:hypothetical protein
MSEGVREWRSGAHCRAATPQLSITIIGASRTQALPPKCIAAHLLPYSLTPSLTNIRITPIHSTLRSGLSSSNPVH